MFDLSKLDKHPLLLEHEGKQLIAIDFAAYEKLGKVGRKRYEGELKKFIDESSLDDSDKEKFLSEVQGFLKQFLDGASLGHGGAMVGPYFRMPLVLFDSETISLENLLANALDISDLDEATNISSAVLEGFDAKAEEIIDRFVQHHESAHVIAGESEEAADYIATILTLKDFPDGRETLLLQADLRMIQSIMIDEDVYHESNPRQPVIDVINKYGYENYMAIQAALMLSDEEIASMTDDEVLENAQEWAEYSQLLNWENQESGTSAKPAFDLHRDFRRNLIGVYVEADDGSKMYGEDIMALKDLATIKLLAEGIRDKDLYLEGTLERQMLDDVIDALERLTESGYDLTEPTASPEAAPTHNALAP